MIGMPHSERNRIEEAGVASARRYSRQTLLDQIGEAGQHRLADSCVLLVGCGALGTVLADILVRAGVGFMRICDRDFLEENNLQRQVLFDETDLASGLPKAPIAAGKLRRINSQVTIEPIVADATHSNIAALANGAHLILDGTDNFQTRYLLNDFSVSNSVPWVYGGVIATTGLCMAVVPGTTVCLRCMFDEPPSAEESPTCETAGVLGAAVHLVAALQATEGLKILLGRSDELVRGLTQVDAWTARLTTITARGPHPDCPCCGRREFPWLSGQRGGLATTLCGRDAVQISPPPGAARPDLHAVAARLSAQARRPAVKNEFLVRAEVDRFDLTVFADGRVIIKGTSDAAQARSLQAKYIGA